LIEKGNQMSIKDFVIETIKKYPTIKDEVIDAYNLMLDEIDAGESEENEKDHFYSDVHELRGETSPFNGEMYV
jgi:hypothetical protein